MAETQAYTHGSTFKSDNPSSDGPTPGSPLIELEALVARLRNTPDELLSDEDRRNLRRLTEQVTPSRAELDELIDRLKPSVIDYSQEDDELPC